MWRKSRHDFNIHWCSWYQKQVLRWRFLLVFCLSVACRSLMIGSSAFWTALASLHTVFPAFHLTFLYSHCRSVTKLLARMFSDVGSKLSAENQPLWYCFLGRFNDIAPGEIPSDNCHWILSFVVIICCYFHLSSSFFVTVICRRHLVLPLIIGHCHLSSSLFVDVFICHHYSLLLTFAVFIVVI